jgi:hypothetical protein
MIQDTSELVQCNRVLLQSGRVQQIKTWLLPPDPSTDYRNTLRNRFDGSGRWFFESKEFERWAAAPNSCLWLHGMSGCGKTFLSCSIIQELSDTPENCGKILYFFFKFSDMSKQSSENMLRSLAFQLYQCCPDAAKHLDSLYQHSNPHQPDIDSLWATFGEMVKTASEVVIVLDALDECTSLEDLVTRLHKLGCQVLMTSRELSQIRSAMELFDQFEVVSFQNDLTDQDIRAYVQHKLRNPGASKLANRWKEKPELLSEIEGKVMEKADGM